MQTINRAEIFRLAWVWAKQEAWSRRLPKGGAKAVFADCLRQSWAQHKSAAARVARSGAFASIGTADLRRLVESTDACDRLGWAGIERLSEMRHELTFRA